MSNKLEERYATLMATLPTIRPGKLRHSIAAAWDVSTTQVGYTVNRLRSEGYDLTAYDTLAACAHYSTRAVSEPDRDYKKRYALIMAALPNVPPGKLSDTIQETLGYTDRSALNKLVRAMRSAGLDMTAWDVAAKKSRTESPSLRAALDAGRTKRNAPAPTQTPDHVQARRVKWLADMRAVVDEPAAIELLCERWGCSRDVVNGRAEMLRNAGHDLTWWRPSRGFGIKKAPVQALKVDPLPLPTVEAPKREKRQIWAAEVPYTMQSVADIVGMPVMAVRFAARAHGIGFDVWCLAPDVALGLLAALGFERVAAA